MGLAHRMRLGLDLCFAKALCGFRAMRFGDALDTLGMRSFPRFVLQSFSQKNQMVGLLVFYIFAFAQNDIYDFIAMTI